VSQTRDAIGRICLSQTTIDASLQWCAISISTFLVIINYARNRLNLWARDLSERLLTLAQSVKLMSQHDSTTVTTSQRHRIVVGMNTS